MIQAKPRQKFIYLFLVVLCICVSIVSLASGTFSIKWHQVVLALFGQGPDQIITVVTEWRLPRVVMALIMGAALGASGAIFQSLIRNPLGSPDVIGFNTGAYTGVIISVILFGNHYFQMAASALLGGLGSALVVYLLAYKKGIQGFNLIVIGIAVSAVLTAFNTWMLMTSSLESAMSAALWGAGTLNGMTWAKGTPAAITVTIVILISLLISTRMSLLEMGDDAASALGVPTEKTRLVLLVVGVTLTASVTAAAGPISFISLAAPQIAKRLTKHHSVHIPEAALMGAALLVTADFIAQQLFAPNQLPVGLVTVSVGGIYLLWLLIRES